MKEITFNKYQVSARQTAVYPRSVALPYLILGLSGEAGEIANKYKKVLRGDNDGIDVEDIKKELGDVLWYLALIAHEFGIDFSDVANTNIKKLSGREKNGTLLGDGDNR